MVEAKEKVLIVVEILENKRKGIDCGRKKGKALEKKFSTRVEYFTDLIKLFSLLEYFTDFSIKSFSQSDYILL